MLIRYGGLHVHLEEKTFAYEVHVKGRGTLRDVRRLKEAMVLWRLFARKPIQAWIPIENKKALRLAEVCGLHFAGLTREEGQLWSWPKL